MADLEDKGTFSEHYPAPPLFWRKFTDANVARIKEIKESGDPVPQELRALVPPPAPTDGKYRSFGDNWNLYEALPPLEEVGQERLFPESPKPPGPNADSKTQSEWTIDRAFHLQKIVRSILLNFLELVGTLSQDATQTESKIGHLTNLFVNAFHILNEYRPHQARETLILLMEEQVERRKNEIQAMKMMKERVDDMATALPQGDGAQTNGHASGITNGNGHSAGNQIWLELDD